MTKHVRGGQYLERDWTGRLIECGPETPDFVICRRVADYAPAPVPPAAAFTTCTECGAAVAYNPVGAHPTRPKICFQCGGIEPLPIES